LKTIIIDHAGHVDHGHELR